MSRLQQSTLLALLTTALLASARAQPAATPAYRVITDPSNAIGQLERTFVADAFLKKVTRWNDGTVIRPVDQMGESAVRRRFSDEVIRRSVVAVKSYWQQLIFSGRDIPPPELDSDEAVLQYVLKHPGSLGYVSGAFNTGRAKVIAVR